MRDQTLEKAVRKLRSQYIGKFLLDHRVKAGLTQKDLARKLRYKSAQFVSNWERGLSLPPTKQFLKLSQLLKVDPQIVLSIWSDYQTKLLEVESQHLRKLLRLR